MGLFALPLAKLISGLGWAVAAGLPRKEAAPTCFGAKATQDLPLGVDREGAEMKIWFWWGLMLCQRPFLPSALPVSSPAGCGVHGPLPIARQIFPLCISSSPFAFSCVL